MSPDINPLTRIEALEAEVKRLQLQVEETIPESIDQAVDRAIEGLKREIEALKKDVEKIRGMIDTKVAEVNTRLDNQVLRIDKLSTEVAEIKKPKPAGEIAKIRTPHYRDLLDKKKEKELKKALAEERLDVLIEVVSKLDIQKVPDQTLLSTMLKLVEDPDRFTALVSAAGTKVERATA